VSADSRVRFRIEAPLGIVELDHSPTRNALTEASMVALDEIATSLALDGSVRALLITGIGDQAFSSGADIRTIDDLRRLEPRLIRERLVVWQRALLALQRLEKPVIAALNGVCAGGGAELALACDIRLAATRARFGLPEVRLGLAPDMGASQRLARIVGLGWAKHLILTGEFIDADTCLRIGLVSDVLADDSFASEAREFATRIARSASPLAVGVAKRLVERNFSTEIETALERELSAQSTLYGAPDVEEGYRAFTEKRPPNWG